MPRRKEILADKIRPYHIMGKTIEERSIFDTQEDRARFIFQMYAANRGKPVINLYRKDIKEIAQAILEGSDIPQGFLIEEHPPLVHIFSFALAKDRYHLGIVPVKKDGIPLYMQKLNLGFAKYYNLKYKRTGTLFEGRFKAAAISNPKQLGDTVLYMNIRKALETAGPENLPDYPYSSFLDLYGQRNSHLLSRESRETLRKILGEEFFTDKQKRIEEVREMIRSEYFDKRLFFESYR